MEYIESEFVELKEIINSDFKKEIIAFANTNGGKIYVGVTKSGEIIGVKNIEDEMEKIGNMIRDGIKPDLTAYTSIERIHEKEKNLIKVTILRGEKRPYHLTDKGLKTSGVYIRHGISSAPASEEAIREMIKESDGTTFDKARSINQDLTFEYAEQFFKKRNVGFSDKNKKSLKLITNEGYFTNAALLLSDQCEHSIKCAVYSGDGKTNFQSRKEFFGSVLKQMDEAYEYISLNNKLQSTFKGLYRVDTQDYPDYAIREALMNSIVHRDYDYSGSTIINIFSDRMEFISLGGLLKGITLVDIMSGISQPRNSIIASIFYRLELIESYGTGIMRIIESYKDQTVQPSFSSGPASFVVKLPNINEINIIAENSAAYNFMMTDEEKVMEMFKSKEFVTRKDIQKVLQVSSFPANNLLNKLMNEGKIIRVGSARATRYIKKY